EGNCSPSCGAAGSRRRWRMIDGELESVFDELFVGDDPPRSVDDALGRLPSDLNLRLASDDDARRTLAELVWMSTALRADARRPAEASFSGVEVASLVAKRETGSLAKALAAPAGNLATVGKTLEKEVKPIRDSVRDAFAFLGDFPGREKRSL